MKKSKIESPDFSQAYREAGAILAENGNRLKLIEAIVVLLATVSLYVMLSTVFYTGLENWIWGEDQVLSVALQILYWLLVSMLTLFVTLPSLIGLFFMAGEMERGHSVVLADLFAPFSSACRYRRALSLSWSAFWRLGLIVLAVVLTCLSALNLFAGDPVGGILCGVFVAAEIVLGLFLCMRRFPVMAVALYEEIPCARARAVAGNMMRMCRFGGVLFFFGFVPWVLLGLLTVGILLLWDTLPRMSVAYFRYCRQMNEMIIRSEEYKDYE